MRRGRPSSESRISRAAASSTEWSCSSESLGDRAPGRDRASQSASAFHLFPIPATRRWSRIASPTARPRSPRRMRAAISSSRGGRSRMSGPSRGMPRAWSSSTGPFHCRASTFEPRRTSHGRPRTSAAARHKRPAAVHPQVAAEHVAALEAEQQVLAHCLDRKETAAVELLGDPADLRARVRRLHLDLLADERLEAARGAMEGVSFRHGVRIGPVDTRAALAGATAALVWAAQEPLDRKVFGCDYSDVALLGKAVSRKHWQTAGPPAPCRERRALRARLAAPWKPGRARARRERRALAADRTRRPLPPRAGRGRAAAAPREQGGIRAGVLAARALRLGARPARPLTRRPGAYGRERFFEAAPHVMEGLEPPGRPDGRVVGRVAALAAR